MSICLLCHQTYDTVDSTMEQRLIADTEFCNICFTEFMADEYDSNCLSPMGYNRHSSLVWAYSEDH